jgi:hypothetical protein
MQSFGGATEKPVNFIMNSDSMLKLAVDRSITAYTSSFTITKNTVGNNISWLLNPNTGNSASLFIIGQEFSSLKFGFLRYENDGQTAGAAYQRPNQFEVFSHDGAVNGMFAGSFIGPFRQMAGGTERMRMRGDSVIWSTLKRSTDSTGKDVLLVDRTTGDMTKMYPNVLAGFLTSTLDQVYATQSYTAVATSNWTINKGSNGYAITSGSSGPGINMNAAGAGIFYTVGGNNNHSSFFAYQDSATIFAENVATFIVKDSLIRIPYLPHSLVATGKMMVWDSASGNISARALPISGAAWNDITSPAGDQALTFDAGESSTWTNSNTTEDLLVFNSSTMTTSSQLSINSTSTALAAGNNLAELVMSGANGTNAITATLLRGSVTNTNATSGTNVGFDITARGATTDNIAIDADQYIRIYPKSGSGTARLRLASSGGVGFYGDWSIDNSANLIFDATVDPIFRRSATNIWTYSVSGLSILSGMFLNVDANTLYVHPTNNGVGFGTATPTARGHFIASTTAVSGASIKIGEGSRQTTPEDGTINYVANNIEFVETSTVYTLAKSLTGTATLDFGSTVAGTSTDLTITLTGVADGEAVSLGVPNGSTLTNGVFTASV